MRLNDSSMFTLGFVPCFSHMRRDLGMSAEPTGKKSLVHCDKTIL